MLLVVIEYTQAADVWSYGCTLLELATHKHSFAGMGSTITVEIAQGALSTGGKYSGLSQDLRGFLACIFVDAARRPSAAELLQHPFLK